MIVEKRRTLIRPEGIVDELRDALRQTLGREPSPGHVAIMATHSAVETAHGRAMWHHNFGNITGSPDHGTVFVLSGDEGSGSDAKEHYYRVYPDYSSGAEAFVGLIESLWPKAWATALRADDLGLKKAAEDYAHRLQNQPEQGWTRRYAEVSDEHYRRAMVETLPRYAALAGAKEGRRRIPPLSWAALLLELPWQLWDSGVLVRKLQTELNRELDAGLAVDGKLGPKTLAAVKRKYE